MKNITTLFHTKYPIIQGGMIWCSGWKLASAVSNAGGLGLIGAGSMHPETLEQHIRRCKQATPHPFGVNVPLLYPQTDEIMEIIVHEGVKIVFISAGNPKKYTAFLKEKGITVVHVIASKKFALKAQEAGVDAIVAEGFEAGGHNGFEETTTLVLLQMLRDVVHIPIIAAGGIGSGAAIYAAIALGAAGVQIGSLFAASAESSAHEAFKQKIVDAGDGETYLSLKQLVPVRMLRNPFFENIHQAELSGTTKEELVELLGKGRAKKGMFEGDITEGELEIGQVSGMINTVKPVSQIMQELVMEYNRTAKKMSGYKL
ncbi:MAG: 2-nitropropane dioxygenase [bacterium]|nr:MAG: 2-nitropropane dioxygenase [bacterium]